MPQDVVDSTRNVVQHGKEIYSTFVQKRIVPNEEEFTSTLKKSKLKLFHEKRYKSSMPTEAKITKNERTLCMHVCKASQAGRDISNVFAHESSEYPPSLAKKGEMHHGTKSDILSCFPTFSYNNPAASTAAVIDGPVAVCIKKPGASVTFEDYADHVFIPYILSWLVKHESVDVVWDVYDSNSLKAELRRQRGSGIRRCVTLGTKIPGNWAGFL